MEKRLFNKNYILVVLSATLFYISAFMLNSITGRYTVDLGADKTISGIITSVFTLTSFVVRPYRGYTADKKGRKVVYITGAFLCLGAMITMLFAKNVLTLAFVRTVFGAGYSLVTTAGGAMVCDTVPADMIGKAIAYYGVTNVFSQAFAPGLALWLYNTDFFVLVVVMTAVAAAVVVFSLFIRYDEKGLINPRAEFAFTEKTALPAAFVIFPFAAATAAVYSFIPLMARERNIGAIELFFTFSAATLLVGRVFNSAFLKKLGKGKTFYTGCLLFASGFGFLAVAGNIVLICAARIIYGLGAGLVHPVVNTAAVDRCTPDKKGLATGTFMMSQDLGMTLGAVLWGILSEKSGFFILYTAVALCGIIMLLLYKKLLSYNE